MPRHHSRDDRSIVLLHLDDRKDPDEQHADHKHCERHWVEGLISRKIIETDEEELAVQQKLGAVFEQRLNAKGFHLLNWGTGGWVQIFSKKPLKTLDDVKKEATRILGSTLVTHQTGPHGKKVNRLYIEEGSAIAREFYLSALVDRVTSRISFVVSTEGGMDIEEVARSIGISLKRRA